MRRLQKVVDKANAAEAAMRAEFVAVLEEGASFAELSKASGVSTSTLQKWKKVAGK
ncbi:MAG: hypothetical protein JWM31_3089 [Solirubrobacterales bacterium]|nr:hypothetical protein [Solirubrobacterales bacterium]